MSVSDDELFNPADFESIELVIRLKNLTMDHVVPETFKITLVEVGDQALTFSLPANSCAIDSHVMFTIAQHDHEKNKDNQIFTSTARVTTVEEEDDGIIKAELKLLQYDKKSWNEFLALFSRRQEEISRFFEMGKK